jgi:DNA polymerase-3 subunit delta
MPLVAEKALRSAIKERSFDPVYYLYGDDDYLKNEGIRAIVDAAADPATRDFNVELLQAAELDAERLGSVLGTPPMMADRRVVVLRDVGALKKDARAVLDDYLRQPAPDILLLLVAPAEGKEVEDFVATATAFEYTPLGGQRIPKWIAYYAEHEHGTSISEDAIGLLQDAVGTDLAQLKIELDKLASYTSGGAIDTRAVEAVVGVRAGETIGSFLDAVAMRDGPAALAVLPTVLDQPKASAVLVIMALGTQILGIGWARAARDHGTPMNRLSKELFDLLKSVGSAYTGRAWSAAVSTWMRAVDRWSPREIDDALEALLRADAAAKTTRISSDEQLLASLTLELCGAATGRRAA